MPLIQLDLVSLSFGEQVLLEDVSLNIRRGERIGLIGRNGEGKSTFLKTLTEQQAIDGGRIIRRPELRISMLSQELPEPNDVSIEEFIAQGVPQLLEDLQAFNEISMDPERFDELEQVQARIDSLDGWTLDARVQRLMNDFNFTTGQRLKSFSGGWRRKAALAQALIAQPDVLLLDEPTNHLDIGLIAWLEKYLTGYEGALVFITHDRRFLQAVATKILELDRGKMREWEGTYQTFLTFKAQELETEEKHNALFDKRLAQEEVWIRQGIKARRTRNEGRVRALKKLRDERSMRRNRVGVAKMEISKGDRSGKLVAELENVSFSFPDKTVIRDFSCNIIRGDKIGLVGPNGYGKSTLLKLILGELDASIGDIKRGTKLSVSYFDQLRTLMNLEANVIDNVAEGRDSVEINGQQKHILSYLQDFMFSPVRARTPLKALSGGERSRVMLAKLFCKASNLLVLDEPTNDLDTETLELLESMLVDYKGTVLLVTHDRNFLDNVVTSTIVFEGNAVLNEYVGGYDDWIRQGGVWPESIVGIDSNKDAGAKEPLRSESKCESDSKPKLKKLSYKLQRELDELPQKLETLETKIAQLNEKVCASDFYQQDAAEVSATLAELESTESELSKAFSRWEELEALSN